MSMYLLYVCTFSSLHHLFSFIQLRKSECIPDRLAEPEATSGDEAIRIRPSKSDTSLTESFVIVGGNGEEVEVPTPPPRRSRQSSHILREGNISQIKMFYIFNSYRYFIFRIYNKLCQFIQNSSHL